MASNPPFSTAVSYNSATPIPLASLYASAKASGISLYGVNPNLQERVHRELQPERAAGAALGHGCPALLRRLSRTPSGSRIQHQPGDRRYERSTGSPVHSARLPPAPWLLAWRDRLEHRSQNQQQLSSNYNAMWAVLSKNMSNGLEFKHELRVDQVNGPQLARVAGRLNFWMTRNNPTRTMGCRTSMCASTSRGTAIYELPFHKESNLCAATGCRHHAVPDRQPRNIVCGQLKL